MPSSFHEDLVECFEVDKTPYHELLNRTDGQKVLFTILLKQITKLAFGFLCFLWFVASPSNEDLQQYNKMPFTRYVEVGRIVLINFGPLAGKLATVVDIVDQNKCLIDGPVDITEVDRQVISYSRIELTDLVVKISKNARAEEITEAWKEADIQATWDASRLAKKLEKKKRRQNLTDFDRFKVMVAKKQKSAIIAKKLAELE